MGRLSCEECKRFCEVYEKPTPCDTCMPEAYRYNIPFLKVYAFCSDQYIVGGGGAIAINFLAVDRAMDYFEIDLDERVEFYDNIRSLVSQVLVFQRQDSEAEEKRKAAHNK